VLRIDVDGRGLVENAVVGVGITGGLASDYSRQ
jgi:hypothetical protein